MEATITNHLVFHSILFVVVTSRIIISQQEFQKLESTQNQYKTLHILDKIESQEICAFTTGNTNVTPTQHKAHDINLYP
jgi:hypothetical protein